MDMAATRTNLEDMYGLSPLQQGILFHLLAAPGSGVYHEQVVATLAGPLDPGLLARAWQQVADRHPVLRTAFVFKGVREPVQAVHRRLELPVERRDWREASVEEQERRLAELLEEDRVQGFDLTRAPLLRCRLIAAGEESHLFVLSFPHLLLDGWSLPLVMGEVLAFYEASRRGGEPALPPVRPFRDYILWLKGRDTAADEGYWRQTLAGFTAATPLPAEPARPAEGSGSRSAALSEAATEALAALARDRRLTLNTLAQGVWALLLGRLAGVDDVVFGITLSGRPPELAGVERMVGLFLNTVPLRARLPWREPLSAWLARLHEEQAGRLGHAHTPLPAIRRWSEVPPGRPLFETLLVFENYPVSAAGEGAGSLRLGGLEMEERSNYPLALAVIPGSRLALRAYYDRARFEEEAAERLLGHLEALLGALAAEPEAPLGDLPLLRVAERHQLVVEWNDSAVARGSDVPLPRRFASWAAAQPQAEAVRFGGESWSYGELAARAGRLARALRRLGVGPEVVVGLCLERSLLLPAAVLAVLEAGGAYLPLDPAYPAERLAFMVRDSGAPLVLTQRSLAAVLPEWDARTVLLEDLEDLAEVADEEGLAWAGLDQLAYVIYTSGSTGEPKGVGVSHHGLANLAEALAGSLGMVGPGERVLQFSALSFDASVWETAMALGSGASLVLARPEELLPGSDLLRLLASQAVSVLTLPPSVLSVLPTAELPALRTLVVAGEACPAELVERWGRGRRFWNAYGPTETTVCASAHRCAAGEGKPPIGRPIANARAHVVDQELEPVPPGSAGDLVLSGANLARGYLGRPALTAERFVPDPLSGEPGSRLYLTGDLARRLPGGTLDFLGRADEQVKVRGFRIEPGEVEAVLLRCPAVREAVVAARQDGSSHVRLVAYWSGGDASSEELRRALAGSLPGHLVPSLFLRLPALPRTPAGKVDRRALPAPESERPKGAGTAPESGLQQIIAGIWRDVLGVEAVGVEDNFFDLGGDSLLLVQVQGRLEEAVGFPVPILDLLRHPTVAVLARRLSPEPRPEAAPGFRRARPRFNVRDAESPGFAVVGMAGRFPGASDIEEFWQNVRDGVESISFFTEKELAAAGVDAAVLRDPLFVRAKGVLSGAEQFDARLFGYSPQEARLLDPQHRLFLECAWEALEEAGCDPGAAGAVGVFGGAAMNTYLAHIWSRPEILAAVGPFQAMLANDKDFLPTRVSYKLDLRGPSFNVQTACSTSLVAVHLACRSLAEGECDVALAGGVAVTLPRICGYHYTEGGIHSPDGHCRAFDERAQGVVVGEGVGILVLKRLADALAGRDRIRAVIRGSAINNDGAAKVGFTAPSIAGQAEVIGAALDAARVDPATLGYVEAHGTGTALGDPVEVAALSEAFGARTARRCFCALGSVKTNIGHADAAAGVAGLIKTVRALEEGVLPPSLHFTRPNPRIDFAASPFYVNAELRPWPQDGGPRRAGVSAFGLGGTNAHVVLEEAPPPPPSGPSRPWQLLTLSAADETALEAATDRLAGHLAQSGESLADTAFTLAVGRRQLRYRRIAVCRDGGEAAAALAGRTAGQVFDGLAAGGERPVAFLFSGLGDQAVGMARELYATEPVFREELDRCCDLLEPRLGLDLRRVLYPAGERQRPAGPPTPDLRRLLGRAPETADPAEERLRQTRLAHPAVFAVEIALARLWRAWGVEPEALLGYSLGEYTAACLAGVMSLEDALALVAERARLIDSLPPGAMLAVPLPEEEVLPFLGADLSLAAVNAPRLTVVAGPEEAVARLERELAVRGVVSRRLATTHAFHSVMMEPIAGRFAAAVRRVVLSPPRIPYLSNVTGTWITAAEATDPEHWVRHLLGTVRFAEGLGELLADPGRILLEVGPGQALATSARQHPDPAGAGRVVLASLPDVREGQEEEAFLLRALGRLWLAGARVDRPALWAGEERLRVALPGYPFQRQRYWIEPGTLQPVAPELARRPDPADWFYIPFWRRTLPPEMPEDGGTGWCLLFADRSGLGDAVADRLESSGRPVVRVRAGARFARCSEREYEIAPDRREDYAALLAELESAGRPPRQVAHLWSVLPETARESFETAQELGFLSLLWLGQALAGRTSPEPLRIDAVTSGLHAVVGGETLRPEGATILGACLVIPRELPGVSCRSIDVAPPSPAVPLDALADALAAELAADGAEPCVAWRGAHRWARFFDPVRLAGRTGPRRRLRRYGVYLITGGLGGIALAVAGYLAREHAARLVLVPRSSLPPRESWEEWLAGHGEEDRVSRRIRSVLACEAAGSEVLVIPADVSDPEQMRRAVAQARSRFGRIHGVLHTAGVPGGGLVLSQTPEKVVAAFAPKVAGARILGDLFAGGELDFLVLCSSLVSIVGLPDRAEYSAANAFLDAFAHARTLAGEGLTLAVNWDGWYGTGMGIDPSIGAENGLSAEEGVEALLRVLDRGLPQVAVSTRDLPALIAQSEASSPDAVLEELARQRTPAAFHPRPQLATPYAAPRDRAEEILARLWGEVLGLEQVGIHDNFLELGGDSILSLQVIGKARREGLHLSLAQVFERPTIAALAAEVGAAPAICAEQGAVTGPAPLTPIQAWFFEQGWTAHHHWNQSFLLAMGEELGPSLVARALGHLLAHHDALRMRFEQGEEGELRQSNAPPEAAVPWLHVDLSALSAEVRAAAREQAAAQVQASLDLASGPLLRAAFFDSGRQQPSRLLIAIHHLVVDAVSWRILFEDLETACAQLRVGVPVILPPKTTSFRTWAERLAAHARSGAVDAELEHWLAGTRFDAPPLPVDLPGGANTVASRRSITAELSADDTQALLREVPQVYGVEINDVLLTALAAACREWTGWPTFRIDLEGHGRESVAADVDLSRTVGWFTTLFPVLLDLAPAGPDPGEELRAVQGQLRAIPRRGTGFGLLRYLAADPEVRRRLAILPRAEVIFVYLGQLDQGLPQQALLTPAPEPAGPEQSPLAARSHLFEVFAAITGGRLQVTWAYSAHLHQRETAGKLAERFIAALRNLVRHCQALAEGRYAPAHFPEATLSQAELDDLVASLEMPEE
jgi:amino acid adenylation domain-containing protein/non-ribosomal peptide synthase protein (TIGR01720 family)